MVLCLVHSGTDRFDALLPSPGSCEENFQRRMKSIIDQYHASAEGGAIK